MLVWPSARGLVHTRAIQKRPPWSLIFYLNTSVELETRKTTCEKVYQVPSGSPLWCLGSALVSCTGTTPAFHNGFVLKQLVLYGWHQNDGQLIIAKTKTKKKNTKQVPKITWGLLCSTQVAGTHSPRSQDRGWRQQPGRACVQDKAWWFGFSNTQLYLQQSTRTSHVPSSPLFRTQGLPWWLTSGPTNAIPAVSRSWYSVLQRKNTTTRHHAALEQLVRRGRFLLIPLPFDIGLWLP